MNVFYAIADRKMRVEKRMLEMIRGGNHRGAMRLIENNPGINVSFRDEDGANALELVSSRNDTAMIRFLIEKGADVNVRGDYGTTPLMCAALEHNNDAIRELLQHDAMIDVESVTEGTALHWACANLNARCAPTVELLLDAGADHTIGDEEGLTVRDHAASFSKDYPEFADEYGSDRKRIVEAIDAVERRFLLSVGRKTSTGEAFLAVSPKNGQIRALRLPEEDVVVIRRVLDRRPETGLIYDIYYELMTLLD